MNAEELLSEKIVENINIDDDKQEKKNAKDYHLLLLVIWNVSCSFYYNFDKAKHIEPLASIDFKNKDENNDIKMMNENPEQVETSERSERSPSKEIFKKPKPKDPKRVAAGIVGLGLFFYNQSKKPERMIREIMGIACRSNKMASALAMMFGGAITNAFAFSGSNYLFSHMGSNANEEKKRHDKAIEKLEKSTSRME
ncbi:unnamed protein product [Mytilus coruscus]|uniref:Uncharacterized protein n=1 Tax=Mytilus coruscus TaxID=42192 RepID=A0A6J8AKB2_MYTCO|nr:unnamed protein product [Mytilus coruscus]